MSTPTRSDEIRMIADFGEIASGYTAILSDVWGVLHNGQKPHQSTVDALIRFRREHGPVVLVSNSPRPAEGIPPQLRNIGVPDEAWDAIVTSGDATRRMVAEGNFGPRCFHLGPERDIPLFETMDVERIEDPEAEADFVICSGPYDDEVETPEDYHELFQRLVAKGLPMICANPDIVVERGERLIYCAGALARAYDALGGTVHFGGKPHPPIYRQAREALAGLGHRLEGEDKWPGVLFIGDGIWTDITGANAHDIDVFFVTSGIHTAEFGPDPMAPDAGLVARMCRREGVHPQYAGPRVVWS